jgi:tetratricopeptide (TPR) repeat protein
MLLAFTAAVRSAGAAETSSGAYLAQTRAIWEKRAGPAAIVAIYRAEVLLDAEDGPGVLEEVLVRVSSAPDADPEVRAHAASRLATLYRAEGRVEEATRLEEGLGFVRAWRVVGPFDDENKDGFDTAFPPESQMVWDGTYEGKGHQVTWRALPRPAEAGLVPLDQVLTPSEKTAGYAAAFVRVERDTPCVLRGGYNEAHKLWVDGELVASRRNYNGRAFDQYADGCTLRKGWNVILAKVCNQDSGWNFVLRITDPSGGPLLGLQNTADPGQLGESREVILAKDGAPPKGLIIYDPEAILRDEEGRSPSPATQGMLGQYLTIEKTFDRSEDPNVQLLRQAAEGAGSDPDVWITLGDAESDVNKRRAAYQKALDANAESVPALVHLARHTLRRGMPLPALDYLRRARTVDPSDAALEALQAQVLLQFASDGAAAAEMKALYARHPRCTAVQEATIDALKVMGQAGEAAKVQEAYRLTHQNDPDAWYSVLADLMATGRAQEALALFDEMGRRFPMDRAVCYRKATYLLGLDRKAEAEAALSPALAWSPDWPEGRELMGDILQAEGKSEASLASYQEALILKPQMESVKRKVAFLGPKDEGFESSYRVDAKDLPADLSAYSAQQAVVLLDNTVVKVEQSGLSSRYVQRVIEVLQPGAAQQMQSWPIAFDPDRQEVRVLEASILKADGRRVHAETMVTDALSDPQYRLYYRNRNLVLSFPSLAAGDRVWIEYKISDVGEQNDYGKYFGDFVPFAGMLPILMKQYTLLMPEDFPLYIQAKGVESQPMIVTMKGRKAYRWVARDIAHIQQEPGMPGLSEVAPYLHLSTFQNWDALGRWYAKFIADQWEITPEIRAKVAEVTAGAKTAEEKVRAVHRWVVQQTHYVGLEFGVHGFRPYKAKQIFERRFGDCKDKALLMAAMLKVAGLDAAMVLTRTRDNGAIEATPASLAVFNHAICYVPELDLFLDGTAEYTGITELPYQDRGVWVQLVWQDGRTRRVMTPQCRTEDNRYDAAYEVQVPSTGSDAEARASVLVTGQECSWIRRRYQDADKVKEQLEKDLSGAFPGTHLNKAGTSPLADLSSPVTLSLEGTLGQFFRPDGKDRLSARIWLGRLSLSTMYASLETRVLPLETDYPWEQAYKVTYVLPDGASAVLPSPQKVESPFGSAVRESRQDGARVTVKLVVIISALRVEPDQYQAFRAFCQQVDRLTDERIRIELPGEQP